MGTLAYNSSSFKCCQEIWRKDQAGNVMEATYDASGRRIHEHATTIVTGFDDAVRRISTAYKPVEELMLAASGPPT